MIFRNSPFAVVCTPFVLLLVTCRCGGKENAEIKLEKLKSDVKQIDSGFENLAFDVLERIEQEVRKYQVIDYYVSAESESKEENTKNPMNNIMENTTQAPVKENPTERSNKIETPNTLENPRRKRAVEDNAVASEFAGFPKEDQPKNVSAFNNSICPTKTLEERTLERQHIEDVKEEVKKLYDLVALLKDQQKIMYLLDQETKSLDDDLSKRFDTKDLLKILDHVNNNDALSKNVQHADEENDGKQRATHEELNQIKLDLRAVVQTLNKTREILAMERRKEINLEREMKDQRSEINFLKVTIQKLFENNISTDAKTKNSTRTTNAILGAPVHTPKDLPTKTKNSEAKNVKENKHVNGATLRKNTALDQNAYKPRSNELDDIETLLHELRKPMKFEKESRVFELGEDLEKNKQEEIRRQLDLLQRIVSNLRQNQNSKSLTSRDSAFLRRLLEVVKNEEEPQSRVEDDVELELRKLQNAIDNLRPRDDREFERGRGEIKFGHILNKLLEKETKEGEIGISGGNKPSRLSSTEIAALRRRLDDISFGNTKSTRDNEFPAGNGPRYEGTLSGKYTCKMEAEAQSNLPINSADLFGRGPTSQLFSGGFSHLHPPFPAQQQPQALTQSSGYYSTNNAYQPQRFDTNQNLRQLPLFETDNARKQFGSPQANQNPNIDLNRYYPNQGSPQSPQKYSENPSSNFLPIADQNYPNNEQKLIAPQAPIDQYNVAPNIIPNVYQNPYEFHHRTIGLNPALAPSSSSKPLQVPEAPGGQIYAPKETRDQFFLAPQQRVFDQPTSDAVYPQASAAGSGSGQSAPHPRQNTEEFNSGYPNIEELSFQVENLQNVVDNLSKPGYTQTPRDKETVANLKGQIRALKEIMRVALQNSQNFNPTQPNNIQNVPIFLENNPHQHEPQKDLQKTPRRRKSVEDDLTRPKDDSELYDEVVAKVRDMIFDNETSAQERSSSYDDVQRKITDLKLQETPGQPRS